MLVPIVPVIDSILAKIVELGVNSSILSKRIVGKNLSLGLAIEKAFDRSSNLDRLLLSNILLEAKRSKTLHVTRIALARAVPVIERIMAQIIELRVNIHTPANIRKHIVSRKYTSLLISNQSKEIRLVFLSTIQKIKAKHLLNGSIPVLGEIRTSISPQLVRRRSKILRAVGKLSNRGDFLKTTRSIFNKLINRIGF
jgi:hypothetical protein